MKTCFGCGRDLPDEDIVMGMCFGAGAMYWGKCCCQPQSMGDTIEMIKNFINPPPGHEKVTP